MIPQLNPDRLKLPVRWGLAELPAMTRRGAARYARQHADRALRTVGFDVFVSETDPELHGWHGYRINIGKKI